VDKLLTGKETGQEEIRSPETDDEDSDIEEITPPRARVAASPAHVAGVPDTVPPRMPDVPASNLSEDR
jgi:hypothetical protein